MLQKHLFKYKYVWFDYNIRNRQIKKGNFNIWKNCYIIIKNDDIISISNFNDFEKVIDYNTFIRKIKLNKINKI